MAGDPEAARPAAAGAKRQYAAFDAALGDWLGGADPDDAGDARVTFTLSALHADADAYPVASLLGIGEVFAMTPQRLRLALWPRSRLAGHLRQGGVMSLHFVFDAAFHQWRLDRPRMLAAECADAPGQDAGALLLVELRVVAGESVSVDYAALRSGPSIALPPGPAGAATLARWRAQRQLLRRAQPVSRDWCGEP